MPKNSPDPLLERNEGEVFLKSVFGIHFEVAFRHAKIEIDRFMA
jgi:hypothetical protein